MTTIKAECIAKSKHCDADITVSTVVATYPRWIHAEGRTHRALRIGESCDYFSPPTPSPMEDANLSRNAASSRAIPVKTMIQQVLDDPAIPLWWGKNIAGMQAPEELAPEQIVKAKAIWLQARDDAIASAMRLMELERDWNNKPVGAHKQIVNRLLEPWTHITTIFTGTDWANFFALRIHPAAEPHIRQLALEIRKAIENKPARVLTYGEWHTPFVDPNADNWWPIGQSVAACARVSYLKQDGTTSTPEEDRDLHDRLINHTPMHASPAEHQCTPDTFTVPPDAVDPNSRDFYGWDSPEKHGNLRGFIQYRHTLTKESISG